MATKKEILKNPREYSVAELAEFIQDGTVTIYELSKTGHLTPLMRRRIEEALAKGPNVNDEPVAQPEPEQAVSIQPAPSTEPIPMTTPAAAPIQIDTPAPVQPAPVQPAPVQVNPVQPVAPRPVAPPPLPGQPAQPVQAPVMAQPVQPQVMVQPAMAQPVQAPVVAQPVISQPQPTYDSYYEPTAAPSGLKGMFSFKGRIRRTTYFLSILACDVILSVLGAITWGIVLFMNDYYLTDVGRVVAIAAAVIVGLIVNVAYIWFNLAQCVKRSHDIGNSGWYILIPFYGLFLLFAPGNEGTNRYGVNPRT